MQQLDEVKDFKKINIVRAKSAVLRGHPGPKCFEQMPPVYIHQPKFGHVPRYLMKIKDRLKQFEIDEMKKQEEQEKDREVRSISLREKQQLLEGLMHNWDLMQKE